MQVLGASFDTPEKNAAFARNHGLSFPLLSDTDRKLGVAYGAADDPSAASARRISYLIGRDGRIRKAWGKVNAATHAADVLQEL